MRSAVGVGCYGCKTQEDIGEKDGVRAVRGHAIRATPHPHAWQPLRVEWTILEIITATKVLGVLVLETRDCESENEASSENEHEQFELGRKCRSP